MTLNEIFPSQVAYDLSSPYYDSWHWQAFWREYEAPIVLNIANRLKERKRADLQILDIGCGTGWYLNALREIAATRAGIDISGGMLKIAQERLSTEVDSISVAKLFNADVERVRYSKNRYDIILATRLFSHLQNPFELLKKLQLDLRQDGVLILSDVDSTHNYLATKLPIGQGSILAETFKHDRVDLFDKIENMGFVNHEKYLIGMNGEVYPIRRMRDHRNKIGLAGWVAAWFKK